MRKKIIIGNWKMNTSFEEACNLVLDINKLNEKDLESIILTPFTHIKSLQGIALKNLKIGAQNVSQFENGAYTGEISTDILKSLDVEFVAIGHSERRTVFNENNDVIRIKLELSIKKGLKPILCCGEPLEVRKKGEYLNFVESQLKDALKNIDKSEFKNIILAYEPIWAIGTGETASASQAQEVHLHIRNMLKENFGNEIANNITILYGGSVKPSNAKELFSQADIDGALVGGASLNAQSFVDIIKAN